MKIFIDGYGVVAQSITRKLLDVHEVNPKNILVNTYEVVENNLYIEFLRERKISYVDLNYSEITDEFIEFSPDYLLSLYGRRIIPPVILKDVKCRAVNLHPSLLPEYKGCFSCPWTIINGEKKTGITFHEITEGIDSGNILQQHEVKILDNETGFSLYHKLASYFVNSFDSFYIKLLNNEIISKEMQMGGKYYPRKVPHEGYINRDWTYKQIDAFIRALHFPPFKGATLKYKDKELEIDSLEQYIQTLQT